MGKFNQLCVWEGTLVGKEEIKSFEKFFKNEMNVRVKYMEEIETLPTPGEPNTGGRNDVFFYVHDDDIPKFAIPRLSLGIRWWEDVLGNGNGVLYSQEVLTKYPKTWEYGTI
jgi:hypothetical protein